MFGTEILLKKFFVICMYVCTLDGFRFNHSASSKKKYRYFISAFVLDLYIQFAAA